ncbi:MAG: polysaccharide deacetylase family protein [Terrisporobacter sp.]
MNDLYKTNVEEEKQSQMEVDKKIKAKKEEETLIIGQKKEYSQKYGYDARKIMKRIQTYNFSNDEKKMVFLTFDDGPSMTNTPKILNILRENNVNATFFICGYSIRSDEEKALLKRTFDEGNAIGNHTFSHDMKKLYPNGNLNIDAFIEDLNKNEEVMKEILGEKFSTRVIRTPGGFYSWKNMKPLQTYLDKEKMANIDWNALNKDAEGNRKNSQQLVDAAIETSKDKDIVIMLMHDTYGKEETVKSLPDIIQYFKDNGYEFKTLR